MILGELGEDKLGADGDTIYAALTRAHAGLSETQSHALNARLVLLMTNEIGDKDRLVKIFEYASGSDEA
ncbi:MAG: DUF2783 domain-containing protein [Paracoccaceae bacterium]